MSINFNGTTVGSVVYNGTTLTKVTFNGTVVFGGSYNIVPTLSNVTADASNPTVIKSGETKTLTFTANSGYILPKTVTVTGG